MSAVTATHVWLHNAATDGTWLCPVQAVDEYVSRGWVECDAPPEPNPALAEQLAWRAQLAEQADAESAPAAPKAAKPKTTKKAAASGVSEED